MSRLRAIWEKLNRELKYSASNPINFNEIWSFQSTGVRIISLIILYSIIIGFLAALLIIFGPFSRYLTTNDVDIDRETLEKQNVEIASLSKKLETQNLFISNISKLLHGEELDSMTVDEIMEMVDDQAPKMEAKVRKAQQDDIEAKLSESA